MSQKNIEEIFRVEKWSEFPEGEEPACADCGRYTNLIGPLTFDGEVKEGADMVCSSCAKDRGLDVSHCTCGITSPREMTCPECNTDKTGDTDGPTITFGPSAAETIIGAFDWRTNNEGIIVSDDGWIPAYDGDPIHIEELGGIVQDDEERPVPIRDDFSSISEYVRDNMDE